MKKMRIAALLLTGLLTVGSLGACDLNAPVRPDEGEEQIVPDGTDNNGSNSSNNADSNNGSDNSDSNSSNNADSNNGSDNSDSNSGNNETTQNYTIEKIVDFNEGIVVYQGTITAEDGSQTVGYGYIDSTGKVITPPIYEKACVFYKGLAAVVKGETQKGYIDTTGKEVIPCVYSSITTIMDTLAWVTTTDGVEQMINAKGEVVFTATGKEVAKGYYQNGLFWVETKEEKLSGNVHTMTYYNEKGEVAFTLENAKHLDISLRPTWTLDSNFNEYGYALVTVEESGRNKNKMIDRNGKYQSWAVANAENSAYNSILVANDYLFYGLTSESFQDVAFYIDWENQQLTRSPIQGGYAPNMYVGNGYYGMAGYAANSIWVYEVLLTNNLNDYLVLSEISELQNALVLGVSYCTQINGQDCFWLLLQNSSGVQFTTLIDFKGNVLTQPTNEYATIYAYRPADQITVNDSYAGYPLCAGVVKAKNLKTNLFGYIDLQGNWVIPAQYEKVTDFQGEGDSAIAIVNDNTIINRKGEVIFSINEQN